jgi:hypothetical protein
VPGAETPLGKATAPHAPKKKKKEVTQERGKKAINRQHIQQKRWSSDFLFKDKLIGINAVEFSRKAAAPRNSSSNKKHPTGYFQSLILWDPQVATPRPSAEFSKQPR